MHGSVRSSGQGVDSGGRSAKLQKTPKQGYRKLGVVSRSGSGSKSSGGKTLSMENVQSVNAAYGTSGPTYRSDHDSSASSGGYPKGTMTLGRATSRNSYIGRATALGSSPNITTMTSGTQGCGEQSHTQHLQTGSLRRKGGRGAGGVGEDVQFQLRELQRENELLRREFEGGRDGCHGKEGRTSSSVNSGKNIWGPEAKSQDRSVRKEEGGLTSILKEQKWSTPEDDQHLQLSVHGLMEEPRGHRDINNRLQRQNSGPCMVPGCDGFSSPPPLDLTEENFSRLQLEHERQAKELYLLRKTMEEMELRIDSQKQTLGARDESIQRLLEMIQGGGKGPRGKRSDIITMATAREEADSQLGHLEDMLDQREKENLQLREELHRRNQQDPTKTKALQTVIDMKDTKISSLERNIRDLEDEVQLMKTSGLLHPDDRLDELKHMDVYKSHSKFMKKKVDQQKQELNKKEAEMQALQTKLDALTNQNSDCKQHIEVLKESLNAKEQRATTLQTEVDALRVRLEEKESFLSKKTKQLQDLTEEKSTLAGEIRDMKDMLDVKERKVNILQKKIDNLLEQLKDKDKQLVALRDRVKGLQTDSSNTDTALTTLEEALSEKERVIERLREQKDREDRARLDEVEMMRKDNQDLKERLSILQAHTNGVSMCV
uniref:ELKS/RAB6-interacting/CAST family member 2 n=1 Tax=Esox lucius TaxID=8010 RepID=A0A3P8Y079_ESOLU